MKKLQLFFLAALAILLVNCATEKNKTVSVTSPDGKNTIQFEIKDGVPFYAVSHAETSVVNPSKLGFIFKDGDTFNSGFTVVDSKTSTFDETWEQVWGEKHFIQNNYNELAVTLQETKGAKRKLEIQFRAFNDGVALRYIFPEQGISDSIFIMDECTEFNLASDGNSWWIPAYRDNRYEYPYEKTKVSEIDTVHTPFTIQSDNGLYLSIHEANLVDFASMTILQSEETSLKCDLVPWSDGVKVKTKAPFKTPWRTIQIGEKPGDLITSYIILNLNEPNSMTDVSWIQPRKYLGIWWGMHISKYTFWESEKHGASTKNAKWYIDYCQKLGIDRLLIEGWNKGWTPAWYENAMHMFSFTQSTDDFNLEEVVKYGDSKGVKLIGYHETGSNLINYLAQIDSGMALYQKMGIHDIKIGQVGSRLNMKEWHHGQFGVNYYRSVLKKAAEYQLAVNFHEPIKDTGERRTYPNMMSREGARGMEYDAWSEGNPPDHTLKLVFTRMLAGPMDFTPGIFDLNEEQGFNNRSVHTTLAKQLSYYVTLYSPIQMLADLPDNYDGNPAFQFLKDVPVDWDDTKVLNGEIGEYITTVRKDRKSEDWFLGSMTNENSREFTVSLDFLGEGKYEAQIYADAPGTTWQNEPEKVAISMVQVDKNSTLPIVLGEGGGLAVRFKKLN
ncbi:MAG: glycoside hydrolase family 97 protein [Draconibacterium sp.]|nr:glycoside hydrolase family 97 protein [Draconibacterium sp.]